MCELKSEGFFTMADKQKALDTALAQIEKQYGKGAIMRLGQNNGMNVASIPTGSISLDVATGIGGLPRGRIIEIYGPESSGKTTLALHVIAQAQKAGGEAAFIDAEHALDPIYAENLGVDVDSLLVSQPDNGEQALEITEALVRSGAIMLLWSIPWRRWCRGRRSRAKWAIHMWVCMQGSCHRHCASLRVPSQNPTAF